MTRFFVTDRPQHVYCLSTILCHRKMSQIKSAALYIAQIDFKPLSSDDNVFDKCSNPSYSNIIVTLYSISNFLDADSFMALGEAKCYFISLLG